MSSEKERKLFKNQLEEIMKALSRDELYQKAYLDSQGCAVSVKDDLAEDLHHLFEISEHIENDDSIIFLTEKEREFIRCILAIFDFYSGSENLDFWTFFSGSNDKEWRKIAILANNYLKLQSNE